MEAKRPTDSLLLIIIFVLMGASDMFYWNSSLNSLYSVVVKRFQDRKHLADTFTALYSTFAFISALTLSFVGALHRTYGIVGGTTLCVMSLLFPILASQEAATDTHYILLLLSACVAGIASILSQSSGFAYGVILPNQYGGWISFGYGICGVVTFALWMLFSQGVFDMETNSGVVKALWSQFAITAGTNASATLAFVYLTKTALVQAAVRHSKDRDAKIDAIMKSDAIDEVTATPEALTVAESSTRGKLTYWRIFSLTWKMQIGISFLLGLSMMAYPNIGPYGWGRSVKETDILIGLFQIGDFLSRYIPNTSKKFLLTQRTVLLLTALRIVLLVLFIVIKRVVISGILSRFWVQAVLMAVLSLSHGYLASIYMYRVAEGLQDIRDKAKASSIAVTLIVLSIAVGLWLAKLV